MANVLFAKGKEEILAGAVNFLTDTIKVALVKNSYAQNITTDHFLSTISAHLLGADQTLANKSITAGVFDADDSTWTAVATGSTIKCVVIYKDTGNAATSPLLGFIDTITGFPLATNGSDITVQWDNGPFKIFSL